MGVMNVCTREGEAACDTFVPTCVRQRLRSHGFGEFLCAISSCGVCALTS